MTLFSKRTPAFSRALSDSEEELEPPLDTLSHELSELKHTRGISDLTSLFIDRPYQQVLIAIGPIQTAFALCNFQIPADACIMKFPYKPVVSDAGLRQVSEFISIYYVAECCEGTFVLTFPDLDEVADLSQKLVVDDVMSALTANMKIQIKLTILSSLSTFFYQAHRPPPNSFVRVLYTPSREDSTIPVLERPNIISGIGAEFFAYAHLQGIPCDMYILFFIPGADACESRSLLKELFSLLQPLRHSSDIISGNCDYGILEGTQLEKLCFTSICGKRSELLDHLYT